MEVFVGSLFWFIVATSLLVTLHEFGHFWVARRCGVRVLRFSVGLGSPIWSRRGRDGTEYAIGAIPLGGYVKMLDEREVEVAASERAKAFNRKPLGQRAAIVAAGPLFNLGFALFAFWVMLLAGVRDYAPYVGESSGLMAEAGIERGDLIRRVADREVSNWTHVLVELTTRGYRRESVPIEIEQEGGGIQTRRLDLSQLEGGVDEKRFLEQIGLKPWHWVPPARVGRVLEGEPAALAGIRVGDRVIAVGDTPVDRFAAMSEAIQTEAAQRGGRVRLTLDRGGIRETLEVVARKERRGDKEMWFIGVGPELRETVRRAGPLEAIPQAFAETWRFTTGSLQVLWHMVAGEAGLDNLAGPITIAQFANYSAQGGFSEFVRFLALISLTLCIMNLLPVPILDGGHLLYYAIEWVKGSPLSERAQALGHYLGLGALLALMGLAFYNDLSRLVQ
jgi:regulator of sigma E protease